MPGGEKATMIYGLHVLVLLGYCGVMAFLALHLRSNDPQLASRDWVLIVVVSILHIALLYQLLIHPQGVNLSFVNTLLLIGLLLLWMTVIFSLYQCNVAPIAMASSLNLVAIIVASLLPAGTSTLIHPSAALHVILSLIAYSVVALTALQSVMLLSGEYMLHEKRGLRWIRMLPPLVQMERWLIMLIWASFLLLSTALFSGFFILADMFAQRVAHKTVFSIISWVVFAGLLLLRMYHGWRGKQLCCWTIISFLFLMTGFIGSKFIIERLL